MTSNTAALRAAAFATVLGLGCDPNLPIETFEAYQSEHVPQPVRPATDPNARNLLQLYAERNPVEPSEAEQWPLPDKSKRLAAALMIAAAHDNLDELKLTVTPDATWGLPDRRRIGSHPVFDGDGGARFLVALRKAASRMPHNATWTSNPTTNAVVQIYRSGAEPFWTFWSAGKEAIVTRMIIYQGRARIDYIGLWEDGPEEGIDTSNWGAAPPLSPMLREDLMRPPPGYSP